MFKAVAVEEKSNRDMGNVLRLHSIEKCRRVKPYEPLETCQDRKRKLESSTVQVDMELSRAICFHSSN